MKYTGTKTRLNIYSFRISLFSSKNESSYSSIEHYAVIQFFYSPQNIRFDF